MKSFYFKAFHSKSYDFTIPNNSKYLLFGFGLIAILLIYFILVEDFNDNNTSTSNSSPKRA